MKKISIVFVLMSVIMLAVFVPPVSAQMEVLTPTPSAIGATPFQEPLMEGADVFPFSSLGRNDTVLNGPFDSMFVNFSLPDNWQLDSGAAIQLHINNNFTNPTSLNQTELIQAAGATIDVEFNGEWLTTIVLDWNGERTITIPITSRSMITDTPGQHYISLYLKAGNDCKYDHQTTIVIMSDSRVNLTHRIVIPTVDLVQLPRPIYQENSILINNITAPSSANPTGVTTGNPPAALIMAENPTAAEMQAALIVSAGFGRLTGGNLPLITITPAELTDQIKATHHLIFVGKGKGFSALSGIPLPAVYDGNGFTTPEAKPDDGLLLEAVSPWDGSKVILVVSGMSDAGVLKAAQAISSGTIMVGTRSDMAIVSEITRGDVITSVLDDRTLADLGYGTVQLTGVSYKASEYLFFVPAGQMLREPANFKLTFTNSALLDFNQSGMSVLINDKSIGGIRYTEDTSKSLTTVQLNIPGYLLRAGMNRLTVQADHIPNDYCSEMILNNLWTSISNQSALHIPLVPSEAGIINQTTLANYTDFLGTSPTLDSTAFIVAENSPSAIKISAQIAYNLGTLMTGGLVDLKAAFASQIPENYRENNELVIVGKPSQLPIIGELGGNLPAPFDSGSDVAKESVFQVIYRTPNVSVGYLELLSSPWNASRNILAVLGSTDEGLDYSGKAMTLTAIKNKLAGNFAVIRNEQVITVDTRLGTGTGNISATLMPGVPQTTQVPSVTPIVQLPVMNQTNWILPAIGILSILIVIIVVMAFYAIRQRQ